MQYGLYKVREFKAFGLPPWQISFQTVEMLLCNFSKP